MRARRRRLLVRPAPHRSRPRGRPRASVRVKAGRWVLPALALAYAAAAALYGWQAWRQGTPWIFRMRRCMPVRRNRSRARDRRRSAPCRASSTRRSFAGVALRDPVTSYNVAELIGALVMPLACGVLLSAPVHGGCPRAAGSPRRVPGMFYSSLLMQEASRIRMRPWSCTCSRAESRDEPSVARCRVRPRPPRALIRPELVVLPIVVVLAVLIWIGSVSGRRASAPGWTAWHWCAAVAASSRSCSPWRPWEPRSASAGASHCRTRTISFDMRHSRSARSRRAWPSSPFSPGPQFRAAAARSCRCSSRG